MATESVDLITQSDQRLKFIKELDKNFNFEELWFFTIFSGFSVDPDSFNSTIVYAHCLQKERGIPLRDTPISCRIPIGPIVLANLG